MITVKKIIDILKKDVFTEKGMYCGKINDVQIDFSKFRIKSFVVETAKESFLSKVVGSKKGVIIPFSMIKSIGDIVITTNIPESIEKNTDDK